MAEVVDLIPSASLVANTLYDKEVSLGYSVSSLGRVVYFKESEETSGLNLSIATTTGVSIMNTSNVNLVNNNSITLQAYSTNTWGVLGAYDNSNVVYDSSPPTGQIVNPTMQSSQLFVDLRDTSKVIVLSNIQTITSDPTLCPFYTIKDVYGFAGTSTLFISSSITNLIERPGLYHIGITCNFASIDLVANPTLLKWQILNFYDGSLVSRP